MKKDIYFSVIIPTYNPKKFLPELLTSISKNKCINEIEVIISDDVSTEPFDDVLSDFRMMNIRQISNKEHQGFPRAGRQHGADEAKGKWMCFADQDDIFIENAFDKLKRFIQDNHVKNYITSDFIEEAQDTGEQILRDRAKGWTHGKFYEKEFWDKYDIKYDEVKYCEDINLSIKIECLLQAEDIPMYVYENPLYIWRRRKDSLADLKYFADSMPDYMQATLGVIIEYVEKYKENEEKFAMYNVKFIATLLHAYFYFQSGILYRQKQVLLKTVNAMQPIFTKFKELTGFTTDNIIYFLHSELLEMYQQTRNDDFSQIPFIEQMSVAEWFNMYFD